MEAQRPRGSTPPYRRLLPTLAALLPLASCTAPAQHSKLCTPHFPTGVLQHHPRWKQSSRCCGEWVPVNVRMVRLKQHSHLVAAQPNRNSCKLHPWRLPHVQRQRSRHSLARNNAAAAAFLLPFLGLGLQQVQEVSAQVCVLKQRPHKVGNFLGAAVSTAGLGWVNATFGVPLSAAIMPILSSQSQQPSADQLRFPAMHQHRESTPPRT